MYSTEDCEDYVKAGLIEMSEKACASFLEKGDLWATTQIGRLHLQGIDEEKRNLDRAKELLSLAGLGGDPKAFLLLGWSFWEQENEHHDYEEALKWFDLGARNKCNECANTLGLFYYTGTLGYIQDWEKALYYYGLADSLYDSGEEHVRIMKRAHNQSSNPDAKSAGS